MRVCLLTTQDLDADPFPPDDWPCDPRPFLPEADWHVETLVKKSSAEVVAQLVVAAEQSVLGNAVVPAADRDIISVETVVEACDAVRRGRPRALLNDEPHVALPAAAGTERIAVQTADTEPP